MNDEEFIESPQYTEIEKKLVEDWKDVLHLKEINVHDQFFDLGGDSLAAMLCISRMRSAFEIEVSIDTFFLDEASISDFAREIHRLKNRS